MLLAEVAIGRQRVGVEIGARLDVGADTLVHPTGAGVLDVREVRVVELPRSRLERVALERDPDGVEAVVGEQLRVGTAEADAGRVRGRSCISL